MTTFKLRRGISSLWSSRNPVLADGEPGFDSTTRALKVGDGSTAWSSLPEVGSSTYVRSFAMVAETSPVLSPTGPETFTAFADFVVDGGIMHAFYHAADGVRHATSTDGLTFTKDASPILLPDATWTSVGVPCVWMESGTWYMLFRGVGGAGEGTGLATAPSAAGPWTKNPSWVIAPGSAGQWDQYGAEVGPGGVIKVGSTYYAYYETDIQAGGSYPDRAVGIATSTDLLTWTKDAGNPILTGGRFCPSVFKRGAFYYMICPHYTQGTNYTEFEMYRDSTPMFAASTRVYLGVIKRVTGSGFDSHDQDTPVLVTDSVTRDASSWDGGRPWIYYSGESGGVWKTGLMRGDIQALEILPDTPDKVAKNVQAIPRSGKFIGPTFTDRTNVSGLTIGRIYMTPLITDGTVSINQISARCGAGGAGSAIRLGIYTADATGAPNFLLTDSGFLSTVNPGQIDKVLSTTPLPPIAWLAIVVGSGTSPTLTGHAGTSGMVSVGAETADDAFLGNLGYLQSVATTYTGSLPLTCPAMTAPNTGNVPRVVVKCV